MRRRTKSGARTITVHHKSGSLKISVKVVPKRKSSTKKKTGSRKRLYGAAAKAHAKKVARNRRRRS